MCIFFRKCLKHKLDMEEGFEEVSNFVGSACKGETDLVLIWSYILRNCHKVSQDLTANYEFIYGEIYVTFPILSVELAIIGRAMSGWAACSNLGWAQVQDSFALGEPVPTLKLVLLLLSYFQPCC